MQISLRRRGGRFSVAIIAAALILLLMTAEHGYSAVTRPPKKVHRLVPEFSQVEPGETLTIRVAGPGTQTWGGDAVTKFQKRKDGRWVDEYVLLWYGEGSEPSVGRLDASVNRVAVQATPFRVLIPDVPRGKYRIVRRFWTSPGSGSKSTRTLSTEIAVRRPTSTE